MTSTGKGCLMALGAAAAITAAVGAAVGPRLLRQAREVYAPVSEMKRAQSELDAMAADHPWTEPASPSITAEQLERFLAVRRRLDALYQEVGPRMDALPRRRGSLRDVPNVMRGVGDVVSRQLRIFVEERMPPAEYRYLERIVYRSWREALRRSGTDPKVWSAAAAEVDRAAAAEPDPRVSRRLASVAASLRERKPDAPPGIPPELHALLLTRLPDIERYSLEGYEELSMARRR